MCRVGVGGGGEGDEVEEQILSFNSSPYDKGRNVKWSRFIANILLTHMSNVHNVSEILTKTCLL